MALVAELVTKVTAETSGFTSSMLKASGVVVAFSAALFEAVNVATSKIDELGKRANRLGIEFEAFQGLAYAANIAGVPIDSLTKGMQRLEKNVDAANNGNKDAIETFNRLGLSTRELINLPLDKQYEKISEAMGKVANENEQIALSQKLFGRDGTIQLQLMRKHVSDLIEEYDKLGITITESQRKSSEEFQETKKKLEGIFGGFASQVAADVSPAFTDIMKELIGTLTSSDLKSASREMASIIVSGLQFAAKGFDIFLTVLDTVRDRLSQIGADLQGAGSRLALVGRAIAAGSLDPAVIGTAQSFSANTGQSHLGGSLSALESTLKAEQEVLQEKYYKSFIQPLINGSTHLEHFSTAIQKATSNIGSMISADQNSKISDRLKEILGDKVTDNRPVWKDPLFESNLRNIFDRIQSGNLDQGDIKRLYDNLNSLEAEARGQGKSGWFNSAPDVGAVKDLRKYADEQLQGKDIKPIQLIIHTTEGFEVRLAESNPVKVAIINGVNKLLGASAASVGT
jgi:hypothetical protein